MRSARIGILGGMYDPVHDGHLRAAIEARELLDLDAVRLIPCATPPHRGAPNVSAALRAEMVAAAVVGIDELQLDARELQLPPPSYTLRTLESLRAELPDARFVLLLGEDAFRGFHRWHAWREVATLADIAVLRRPDGDNNRAVWAEPLQDWLRDAECQRQDLFATATSGKPGGRVTFCDIAALDISSTRIRELLATERDPRFLLPDAVLEIIEREGLYR